MEIKLWQIKINGVVVDELNLEGQKVIISMESKSLGDNIAWIPYVEKFRQIHKCKMICSTFHNNLFKDQ